MMKKLLLLSVIFLVSCDSDDDVKANSEPVAFVLTQMFGNIAGDDGVSGVSLPFNETIELNENGRFLKTRIQDLETITSEGTYTKKELIDGESYVLVHDQQNILVQNCDNGLNEILRIENDGSLLNATNSCDKPSFIYELE